MQRSPSRTVSPPLSRPQFPHVKKGRRKLFIRLSHLCPRNLGTSGGRSKGVSAWVLDSEPLSLLGYPTHASACVLVGPQFPQPPYQASGRRGPGVPRAQPPAAARWAGRMTSPGQGRGASGSEREGAGGPPPRQAQRPVGLGRAAAAMTQGPGGRAPPAPPAPPEPEAPTTFCALLPRMPQWKFAAPAGFLGRGPAAARAAGSAGSTDPEPEPEPADSAGVPALAAAVLGACEPRCAAPCPLPALSRCRAAGTRGPRGARGVAGPPDAAADEWIRKGSFIHKPAHGWLHPDARVLGPGVSYIVRVSAPVGPLGSHPPWSPNLGAGAPIPHFFLLQPWTPRARSLGSVPPPLSITPYPHRQPALSWSPPPRRCWVQVPTASRGEGRGEGGWWERVTHAHVKRRPPSGWRGSLGSEDEAGCILALRPYRKLL